MELPLDFVNILIDEVNYSKDALDDNRGCESPEFFMK